MTDTTHFGPGVYGGIEKHRGTKEECSAPDCGPARPRPDDPCPEHPDSANDSYPHTPDAQGRCLVCHEELDMPVPDTKAICGPPDEALLPSYRIKLLGCDDSTKAEIHLSSYELEVVKSVARQVNEASDGACQPRMAIDRRVGPGDVDDEDVHFQEISL